LKARLRLEHTEREQEQATQSIMLREIQRMLNDERTKNESLEKQMKQIRTSAKCAEIEAQQNIDYKSRVEQLENELQDVQTRLENAEAEASMPSPLLLQLQEEMDTMKKSHRAQLEKERSRVSEVEHREREKARAEEERVADLENRLLNISSKMGLYDGSRQKDQLSIQKLKDRISQLDVENALLLKQLDSAKRSGGVGLHSSLSDEEMDLDLLKERVIHYQKLFKEAAKKSNEPVDLPELGDAYKDYKKFYLDSQQDLMNLKEEFEKYKTRAQSVLKNKSSGSIAGSNKELEESRKQIQDLKDKHCNLRLYCTDLESKQQQMATDHKREIGKQMEIFQEKLESAEEKSRVKVSEMEREVRNHRERTVAILLDKDKEIKNLKAYISTFDGGDLDVGAPSSYATDDAASTDNESHSDSVSDMLQKGSGSDTRIIHYVEQLARKDILINNLRRSKKQLEVKVRAMNDSKITSDENHARKVAELQEKLDEKERSTLRETANMEYLKNVVYQYLIATDSAAKKRMVTAIATILQFSPDEKRKAGVKQR